MFARAVSIKVKPGCKAELSEIFEQEVIPRFRQERDFLGLLTFIRPDGTEALSLSLWDKKENAGANCPSDLSALTALAGVVRGTPSVQIYEVSNSTLHTMEEMLGQGKGVETIPDLKVYQACATTNPIVARTVHNALKFPASVPSCEFDEQGNPILCRRVRPRTRSGEQFMNESRPSEGEVFLHAPGSPGTCTQRDSRASGAGSIDPPESFS